MHDEQEVHTPERWTDWAHYCPRCHTVQVCLSLAVEDMQMGGPAGLEADVAAAIVAAVMDTVRENVTLGWLSERQWKRLPHGACRYNCRLRGFRAIPSGVITP